MRKPSKGRVATAIVEFAFFVVLLVITFFWLAGPADASQAFMWTTEDGVISFTDDPIRVPQRYWGSAVEIVIERWDEYYRLTIPDSEAQRTVQDRLAERLEKLREQSQVSPDGR